ncbi:MAG: acyl-CoA dehydrogenase family protein [Gemmatimonadetes bacterium]|nr:acyl-CoA dehydrogenase family protein [Gemmatimonadota bacterium]
MGVIPSAEQQEIRALAREFAANEIRPFAAEWDARRELDSGIFRKLADLGFLGMLIPEEYGGLGLDPGTYLLALEELAWGDASVALGVAIHNGPVAHLLVSVGTEEQKREWLPRLASGELLTAFALSEAQAGSDLAAIATRAERTGDGWRITGRKKWVTNGARAAASIVFARPGEAAGHRGIAAFLVETDAEGYRPVRRERTLGLRASETVEVELEGVLVPDRALLGRPDEGFYHALRALDVARLGIAALAVGIAQAALEHAVDYAGQREQFGRRIAEFQAIQFKVADMASRIAAARALAREAARAVPRPAGAVEAVEAPGSVRGPSELTLTAALAKLAASEAAMWVTIQAVQIFGGYGYMRDYPVEKLMRDAKGTEICEGTSEILRTVIAREVLRARANP